jgi:cation:H+ antiporter
MVLNILELIFGVVLLVVGGDTLVRGSASLARYLGVTPLVIGLTVVAFGTSAPELAVNLSAALTDRGDISFGNIIGSNLANMGLIIGLTALLTPIAIQRTIVRREIPFMLLATAAVVAMAGDSYIDRYEKSIISRSDGISLLLLFGIFMYYTITDALSQRNGDVYLHDLEEIADGHTRRSPRLWVAALLTVGGLAGVIGGGYLTVEGASHIALAMGVSQTVVGLTVVAVGTSLPELTASLMAARRGHVDMAIGNVVGSNVFNVLFVLGTTAVVRPLDVPAGGYADLALVAVLSLALLPMARTDHRISRFEGGGLLLTYVGYIAFRAAINAG